MISKKFPEKSDVMAHRSNFNAWMALKQPTNKLLTGTLFANIFLAKMMIYKRKHTVDNGISTTQSKFHASIQ